MPTAESTSPDDRDRERDIERGERPDRGGTKQKSSTSTSAKTSKDLSHVPCKFYKVGGCTAGASCPFSHHLPEPGQKETCAWFVKGNCKFGHKCALAHILPGQSMSMDRKNKKAAQVAAQAATGTERGERTERGGKEGKGGRGGATKREAHATGSGSIGNRNPLLTGGSTAPTRMASSTPTGRPPMSLKTTLSPSAPAPPLASFGVLEDLEGDGVQLATAPAQGKQGSQDGVTAASTPESAQQQLKPKSPEPLPTSAPRPAAATPTKIQDFGPIGSPPASGSRPSMNGASTLSPGPSPKRANGINPTENEAGFFSSSPFSAPGAQSVFLSGSYTGGGVAASLGSGLAMMGGRKGWGGESVGGMAPSSVQQRGFDYEEFAAKKAGLGSLKSVSAKAAAAAADVAVEDEDLEDFLPSSLTDLLTAEERSRRMSRSNSGQQPGAAVLPGYGPGELSGGTGAGAGAGSGLSTGAHHRYSRSVPAPSLLGDIKSIWSENKGTPLPSSPPTHKGTPSQSFISRLDAHGEDPLSMSIGSAGSGMMGLSPSNASAAFLPGLHSHYLNAKAKQAQAQQLGLGGGLARGTTRGVSNPPYGGATSGLGNSYLLGGNAGVSSSPGSQVHTHTDARTNTQHTYRTTPSPFDLTQQQHLHLQQSQTPRPIPSNGNNGGDDGSHLLSPGARALQSHAPGQSLPQGLAAGYSRIHALPPLNSPGSGSAFVSGTPPTTTDAGVPSSGPYGGWKPPQVATSPPSNAGGLEAMFSRLSYSAAAATSAKTGPVPQTGNAGLAPPGLTRNVSGGRFGNPSTPLSPLSGPVVNRDDDDELFSMDG
ncbi:hypothetical protein H2248_003955 [Termitomyces sp. 'cryptogamus']|nr:hypothetical protein H2248_003955 [Termitomyces sp. 'cryptogamus']